jgi:hypothetical protein
MLKKSIFYETKMGNDQEIELQDIEIGIFQEIKIMIKRSKVSFFMQSKVFITYCIIVQEIEKAIETLAGYYLRVFL